MAAAPSTPATVERLLEQLDACEIAYCHWKSNWVLEEGLTGTGDLDLLVERGSASSFRRALQELGFRPVYEAGFAPFPSVEHFHAFDDTSGALVHVHAYYRVISGGSLAKDYHLPLEEMLLRNVTRVGTVIVPTKGAELVVFVLRMSVKHASLSELALLARSRDKVRDEAIWLATDDARREAADLLAAWLPGVDPVLFDSAVVALLKPAPLWRRVVSGRRVRAQLRPYARYGRVRAWFVGAQKFARRSLDRLRGSRRRLSPASGGAVIAFVGAEASGKSTMLEATDRWLGPHYTTRRIHAGKPPSTVLTIVPNLLLPVLRALLPARRSTKISAGLAVAGDENARERRPFPLLFGVRSVLLAHDRRKLLTHAFASAANGAVVLSDRYPSVNEGALDGAQLGSLAATGRLRRWLVKQEARLYRDIPPPDLVIHLTAPLQATLERNRARAKAEPDAYVLERHARSSALEFERVRVATIDTDRPLEDSALEVRRTVWEAL